MRGRKDRVRLWIVAENNILEFSEHVRPQTHMTHADFSRIVVKKNTKKQCQINFRIDGAGSVLDIFPGSGFIPQMDHDIILLFSKCYENT